jgi:hypothetical protein
MRRAVHHGRRAARVDAGDRVLLVHLDAVVARVVQQELVELGADDLVAVRPPARVLAEEEAPRLGLASPLERAAGLPEEAVALDRVRCADRVEDRQRRGQQRLADVVAREALALEHDRADAGVREHGRGDGARRPAADHEHVGGERDVAHVTARCDPPCRRRSIRRACPSGSASTSTSAS